MRKIDELIAIYPGQEGVSRRLILDQFEDVSQPCDSEEVLQLLVREVFDPASEVRRAALFHLSRILPAIIRYRYNVPEMSHSQEETGADRSLKEKRLWGIRACRPLGRALLPLVDSGSPRERTLAFLSLSRLPLGEILAGLRSRTASDEDRFEQLLACALVSQSKGHTEWLIEEIEKHAPAMPDLWLLLSFVEAGAAHECIRRHATEIDALGRINLAIALGNLRDVPHMQALTALMGRSEIWVVLHGLRAVEKTRDPALLPLVTHIFSSTRNEFLRVSALSAAGALPGEASMEFCRRASEAGADRVRTQAIESLIRLGCPADEIRDRAQPLQASSLLRARVTAIIATSRPEEEAPAAIHELLMSPRTLDRMEAAYCLGQIQNQSHLALLMTLVLVDPSARVRVLALKHLGQYGVDLALPGLMSAIGHADPATAVAASRVLASLGAPDAKRACEALVVGIRSTTRPVKKALMYRALGALMNRCELELDAGLIAEGLSSPEASVARGALVGLSYLRRGLAPGSALSLAAVLPDSNPDLFRILLHRFLQGHLGAVTGLVKALGGDGTGVPEGLLDFILEWTLLVHEPGLYQVSPVLVGSLGAETHLKQTLDFRKSDIQALSTPDELEPSWVQEKVTPDDLEKHRTLVSREGIQPILPESLGLEPSSETTRIVLSSIKFPAGSVAGQKPKDRVSQLKDHLRKVPVKEEGPQEFLAAMRQRGVTALSKLPLGATGKGLGPYRYVILSCVLLLSVVIWVAFLAPAPAGKVEGPPVLHDATLAMYRGTVTLEGQKEKPTLGMELKPDAVVQTSDNAGALILTRAGGRIEVGAKARVTLKEIGPGGTSIALEVTPGTHGFDFRKAGSVRVECRSAAIAGSDVWFTLNQQDGASSVMVTAGTLAVSGVSTVDESLGEGDALPLP